jgi:hypothetical protein
MRNIAGVRVAGVLFAAAMVLPVGLIASPAGAVGGTSCKTATGSATFTPALPKLGNKTMVLSTVKATGAKIGGCVGGGVTSATASITAKFAKPGNCTTLATAKTANPTNGTGTWTWNTKKTSTIALTLTGGTGKNATHAALAGTVTAGVFKGSKLSGTVIYAIPAGACQKVALTKVTFKQLTALVIK